MNGRVASLGVLGAANLGKPLTSIPDPFGTHESYGANMNARLRAFLDQFEVGAQAALAIDEHGQPREIAREDTKTSSAG